MNEAARSCSTKICTACFEQRPLEVFAGRTTCRKCRTEAWKGHRAAKADRECHQRQVQLNRLINSIPRALS